MKYIIVLLMCFSIVYGQNRDTLKYTPNRDYGVNFRAIKIDSAFILPRDTIRNKRGVAMLDTIIYIGNGSSWRILSGSSRSIDSTNGTFITKTQGDNYYVKIQTQNPTASLTGGGNYELHSSGTFSPTLNYSAGRLAETTSASATNPIASITVAGIIKPITGCSTTPCTISGTQGVTVTYNTNTTFSNVVLSTDSKYATATTSFNFYNTYYKGYVSSSSPSDADLYTAGYNILNTANSKNTSGTFSNPTVSSYIVFAYPSRFGTATITIGGLVVSYNLTVRSFTNQSGYSELYNIYVSPFSTSAGATFLVN